MIFDTHSHCYWDSLLPDIDRLIEHMRSQGVTHALQIGCDFETSHKALSLANRFPGVFSATLGIHPETAQDIDQHEGTKYIESLKMLLDTQGENILGIGECGLDFHYLDGTEGGKKPFDRGNISDRATLQIKNQKYWWELQWKIAKEYDLPLIIHTRDAREETLSFMREIGIDRCVMHCFSEDWEFARELMELSSEIYFSFSGILTYKNALQIQDAARQIPLDRILIETDAPFLAPVPLRGTTNEPAHTRYVLEKLATLRPESIDILEEKIYENSWRFFGRDPCVHLSRR